MKARHALGLCVLALALPLLCGGCATSGANALDQAEVRVSPRGEVYLGDEVVPMNRLAHELKALGARKSTAIYVEIPEQTDPRFMKGLSETLVQGGLPRIMFTKPRRAEATVDTP